MASTTSSITEAQFLPGIASPDSALVREATNFIQDTESSLLFNHSSRVFCFASLAGHRRASRFDPELLYVGAMFHDIGLVPKYSSNSHRFKVDRANAARDFLRGIASRKTTLMMYGPRSLSIRLPAYPSTCIL